MLVKCLSAWAAIFTLTACTKSSVTVYLHDPLDPSQFTGLKRVADNGNGTYQLTWEVLPSNLKIASKAKYGVFSREVPPANLWEKFLNLFSSSNEYSFTDPFAMVDYKIGNYTTPILFFKHNTCFVIRVIGASEFKDVNKVELCTGHTKFNFAGAKALTANGDNSYNVSWDALPYVISSYHIFTRDEVSGRYNFSEPTVVKGVTAWQSGVLSYKPSQCFVVRAVPVNAEFIDTNINELCTGHHQSFYAGISSLTSLGSGSYKLEWPASTLENTSYKIFERSVLGQYDAQVPIVTSSELSYTKTGITGNYCYLVRAVSETSSFIDNNLKEICINPQIYGDFAGITNSEVVGSDVKLNVAWATGASAMRVLRDGTVINEQTSTQNFIYTDTNAAGATEHLYQAQAVIGGETLAGTAAHTISNANVGDFVGCSSVVALSDTQIQVSYAWPVIDGHTVSGITIYRNGILVSTQVSPSISKYVDSGFTAQESARYTCKVIIDDVELTGKQSLAAVTMEAQATPTAVATVTQETPTVVAVATAAPTAAPIPTGLPTVAATPVPPDVTSLLAVPTSDTVIGLTWTSGGGSTASYNISYASGASAPATCAAGTVLSSTQISGVSITGLTANTQYSFRVCAVNSNVIPDISSGTATTMTTLQSLPPNVTVLGATANSDTVIALAWTSGGGSTASYKVSYASGATAPADCTAGTLLPSNQISGTTANITGLTTVTQYGFRVCAVNTNATPDVSSGITASATTLQAAPPNVTGLAATVSSDTEIALNWTSGGGTTATYSVSYATGATPPATCALGTILPSNQITGTTAAITALSVDSQYSFRVCAANTNATPNISSGATATATTIKAAPADLGASGGIALATLSWTTVAGATNYAIYYSTSASVTKAATRVVVAAPSYQVTSLTGGATYYFNIAVIVGSVESALSSHEATTTTLTAPPSAPTNVYLEWVYSKGIKLHFTASAGATSYKAYYKTSAGVTTSDVSVSGVSDGYIVAGLSSLGTYYVKISAINAFAQESTLSSEASLAMPEFVSLPHNLSSYTSVASYSVRAVAVSGSTIYAATLSGLSISYDNGNTWITKNVFNGLPGNDIKTVYASGNNVYVGAYSYGLGISTNAGATWITKSTSNGLVSNNIKGICASGSNIYVATDGGMSISTNNGSTWLTKNKANTGNGGGIPDNNLYGVYMSPDSTTTIYAPTVGGLAVSYDSGVSWSKQYAYDTTSVYASGTNFYMGTYGNGVYLSVNGAGFVNKKAVNGLGGDFLGSISGSGSTIYAGTIEGGLSISTNGGTNWRNVLGASTYGITISGANIYLATNMGVAISTNSGDSFTLKSTNVTIATDSVRGIYINGANIYAATSSGLQISTNSGATWVLKWSGNPDGFAVSGANIYLATYSGVQISTDNGVTWVLKTSSDGMGSSETRKVYVADGIIYAATAGGISMSSDNGTTWITKRAVDGLASNNTMTVYASGSNIYVGTDGWGLSISTNSGATWVTKKDSNTANGMGADNVYGVYASGSNIYVGTYSSGVSVSTDNGVTWSRKQSGNMIDIYASGSNVYALAKFSGLYVSTDNGANWLLKAPPAGASPYGQSTGFTVSGSTYYIGTNGGGLLASGL